MTFGIESSNIVGYTSKEAPQGKFIILGVQFEGVAGGVKINDLISGVVGVDFDEEGAFRNTAAQIQVPAAVGYDTYYYLNNAWSTETETEVAGWADAAGDLTDAELMPGVAIWCKSVGGDADASVAGAVPAEDEATIACPTVFALRANVFPMDIVLNSGKMSSVDVKGVDFDEEGSFRDTATQIQVPATVGYDTYYYLNNAWSTETGTEVAGWADAAGDLASGVIPAAQGFWTKGVSGAFNLKFIK